MTFLQRVIVNLLTLVAASVIFPNGVQLAGLSTAIFVALILALLEMTLVPILKLLTLPLSLITLGIFGLVIDAGMLELATLFTSNLQFSSFWMALVVAIILRLVNGVIVENNVIR